MQPIGQTMANASAETLILEGYRGWSIGLTRQEPAFFAESWNLFAVALGSKNGRLALDALSRFVKTLQKCATCPLKTNPLGCSRLCLQEVLLLGLISGLQNDEQTTIMICLSELSCPAKCEEVLVAAEVLAATFKLSGKPLKTIPAQTIKEILLEDVTSYVSH
jgi:hypothetical protein